MGFNEPFKAFGTSYKSRKKSLKAEDAAKHFAKYLIPVAKELDLTLVSSTTGVPK